MGNIMGIMWKIYAGKYGDVDGKSWEKSQIPDEFDGYIMVNIVGYFMVNIAGQCWAYRIWDT